MATIKFPKNFLLGGAIAAEEVEGLGNTPKAKTEWDLYYQLHPEKFFNGINNIKTNDMMNHYQEDVDLISKVGCDSLRISISWARLFPTKNKISKEGIAYYHQLIDEIKSKKMKVIVTLMHFDLPAYCFATVNDGWLNPETTKLFVKFADLVLKEYGAKIDYLATFNEPAVALFGYDGSFVRYPLLNDLKKGYQMVANCILAHAKVVELFHKKYHALKCKIGLVANWLLALTKDEKNFDQEDVLATEFFDHLYNYIFLSPLILGKFDDQTILFLKQKGWMFELSPKDYKTIANAKMDWLGINYYAPKRLQKSKNKNQPYVAYEWKQARKNVFRGWEIFPEGMIRIAEIMKKKYHNFPWMIGENGMGVEDESQWRDLKLNRIEDDYRISFISEHLEYLLIAIKKHKANCFGYHLWSAIDNWSWLNAYKNRYGLIEVDLNNLSRRIKKSGEWFAQLSKSRILDLNYPKHEEILKLKKFKYHKSI